MDLSSFMSKHQKPALLQDKLFYPNYSWVLDDEFAVLEMAVDELLTEIILMFTQIRVW